MNSKTAKISTLISHHGKKDIKSVEDFQINHQIERYLDYTQTHSTMATGQPFLKYINITHKSLTFVKFSWSLLKASRYIYD